MLNEYKSGQWNFEQVLHIIDTPKKIYLLVSINKGSKQGEKKLIMLVERDNNAKLERLFRSNLFDIALKFATNLHYDEPLLSEISRLHGDHLYGKCDYANAIEQYKKTVKHLEPSYVIKRFLDVSKIDHLIKYLEHLHKEDKHDKQHTHTALLLNCYVKTKMIDKLKEFIEDFDFDSKLFDAETAINVCKESGYV